jgi:hypothetical protein
MGRHDVPHRACCLLVWLYRLSYLAGVVAAVSCGTVEWKWCNLQLHLAPWISCDRLWLFGLNETLTVM